MSRRISDAGGRRGEQPSRFPPDSMALLAEAGRRLIGAPDLHSVLGRTSAFLVPALADWCVLALTQADGHLRAVALEGGPPATRAAPRTAGFPQTRTARRPT